MNEPLSASKGEASTSVRESIVAQRITTKGFLAEFKARHNFMPDRAFCFILGAGASAPSGIPTGGELVQRWLRQIHEREDFKNNTLEQWATEKNLGIKKFDYKKAACFYPQVFKRSFGSLSFGSTKHPESRSH